MFYNAVNISDCTASNGNDWWIMNWKGFWSSFNVIKALFQHFPWGAKEKPQHDR
jgi:hypothetical protein